MTTSLRLFSLPLLALLGLGLGACSKARQSHGNAAATLAYWNRLNEERPDFADVVAASAAWSLAPGNEQAQLMRATGAYSLVIHDLTERNQKLNDLPMKDVDPALLDYTAQIAAFNATRIELFAQVLGMSRQFQQLASGDQWAVDLFGSFLRHSNDENVFESVLRDQWAEKSQAVGKAIPQYKELEAKIQDLAPAIAQLTAAEVALRAALHKNHGLEFPPSSSFQKPAPETANLERIFTKRRIALDLLGQSFAGWTFEGLAELQNIEIMKRDREENHAGVVLKCDVVGMHTGQRRSLTPLLLYELKGEHWVLLGLTPKPAGAK